jgi:hypothetical protein
VKILGIIFMGRLPLSVVAADEFFAPGIGGRRRAWWRRMIF